MRNFNVRIFILYFVIGLFIQVPAIACDDYEKKNDCSKLPQRLLINPFNPDDYQRLKGEASLEENALKYLKQLEERSNQFTESKMLFTDKEFLKSRDQLANCFLKIFSYSAYLPGEGIMSHILGIHHSNSLEEVLNQPTMKSVIDGIYYDRPLLKHGIDIVFNEELGRDDFNPAVKIGKNPFFDPLCGLLNSLYNGIDCDNINNVLATTRQTLEKRFFYFNNIKPLDRILFHVNKINTFLFPDVKKIAQSSYAYILKENKSSREIYDYDEYDNDSDNENYLNCEEFLIDEPIDPNINRYLSANEKLCSLFKNLKNTIYQDIDYRYGLDEKDPPLQFPDHLLKLRKSIPWSELSALGSAAHLATYNHQTHIQQMFVQALPDLLLDFRYLKIDLTELANLQCAHFLDIEPIVKQVKDFWLLRQIFPLNTSPDIFEKCLSILSIDYQYQNIKKFSDWYTNYIGMGMVEAHIEDVKYFSNSFDKPEIIFKGYNKWQNEHLRDKLPFLQSKSRLFSLYYLFIDGELAKKFFNTLKGKVEKEWINLFRSFGKLRDVIGHETQEVGQEIFEEGLNSLPSQKWEQILDSYISVLDTVTQLNNEIDLFTWANLKRSTNILPPLDMVEKKKLTELENNLRYLREFITNPAESLYKELEDGFNKDHKKKNKKAADLPKELLYNDQKKWDSCFKSFSKKIKEDIEIKEKWTQMRIYADKAKEFKNLKKNNKSKDNPLSKLKTALKNSQWILCQLHKTYDHGDIGRFSSIPEGRIAELYLILLRDSTNDILYSISNYLVFDICNEETVRFLNACNYVSSALPQLTFNVGNRKAHIHRLSEISLSELHEQYMANMLRGALKYLDENISVILEYLSKYPSDPSTLQKSEKKT